jgi:L-fuconolactonase
MMTIIDPHLHLFNLAQGDYHWLKPENPPFWPNKQHIFKHYVEADLQLTSPLLLAGFIHIEAGFNNQDPICELQWLQQHCTLPFKAIGYLDITSKHFYRHFLKMKKLSCFAGIRHILDDNAVAILSAPHSLNNLTLMADHGAIFEAQLDISKPRDIEMLCQVMRQIPTLKVIVNHAGSPTLPNPEQTWQTGLTQLAMQSNCYIKCSGWEMKDDNWQASQILPYIEDVIESFAIERVMLASNFPVSELAKPYQNVWQEYLTCLTQTYTKEQRMALCHDNAKRIYQL